MNRPRIQIRYLLAISFFLLRLSDHSISQTLQEDDFIERILGVEESDLSAEQMTWLQDRPIDLNQADVLELTVFPLITPHLARRIVEERQRRGPFNSYRAFTIRLKLDQSVWEDLDAFFKITRKPSGHLPSLQIRNRMTISTPYSLGLRYGNYPGEPVKLYEKIRIHPSETWAAGLLLEKDAGEPEWTDHAVGFLEFKAMDGHVRWIAGDYIVETGQGLVLWGPYRFSGGSDPVSPYKIGTRGPAGYILSDENNLFRGLACEICADQWIGRFFASGTRMDASLTQNGGIRSFGTSGLHRTESEQLRKNAAGEMLLGADLSHAVFNGILGITFIQIRFSAPEIKEVLLPMEFSGKLNHAAGIYYSFSSGDWNLNGEMAVCKSGGTALISNVLFETRPLSAAFSIRNYEADFHNRHANGISRYETQNEQGGALGLILKKQFLDRVSIRYDLFRRPWNSISTPIPFYGNELFVQAEKTVRKGQKLVVRYRIRREENSRTSVMENGRGQTMIGQQSHQQIRINLQSRISKKWTLCHRLEWICFSEPGVKPAETIREKGFLLFSEIRWQPSPSLQMTGRLTGFQSDSYDSRVYSYETDVPGLFSIPVLYGQGSRHYLLVDYKILKWCRISVKYSETCRDRETGWGSGLDRTDGDTRRAITLQLDVKF